MEHPEVSRIMQTGYPSEMLEGLENVIYQDECYGLDYFNQEIVEGESIVIDEEFENTILREHLKKYLIERCSFIYKAGVYVDIERQKIIFEEELEQYLFEDYGFQFLQAQ